MQLQKKLNYLQDIYQEIQNIKFQIQYKSLKDLTIFESQLSDIQIRIENTDMNQVILPDRWSANGQQFSKDQFFLLIKQELLTQINEARYLLFFNGVYKSVSSQCERYFQAVSTILRQNDIALAEDNEDYLEINQKYQRELRSQYQQFKQVASSFSLLKANDRQSSKIQAQLQSLQLKFESAEERLIQSLRDSFPDTVYDREPVIMTIDQYLKILEKESFETSSSEDKSNNESNEPPQNVEHKPSLKSIFFLRKPDSKMGSRQGSVLFSTRSSRSDSKLSSNRGSESFGRARTFSFSGMIKNFISYRESIDVNNRNNQDETTKMNQLTQENQVTRKSKFYQSRPIQEKVQFTEKSSSDSESEEEEPQTKVIHKRNAFVGRPSVFYALQKIEEERDDDNSSVNAADDLLNSNMLINTKKTQRNTRRSSILSDVGSRSSKIDDEISFKPKLSKRHTQFLDAKEILERKKISDDSPGISDRDSDVTENEYENVKKKSSASSDEAPDIVKDRDAFSNNLPINFGSRFEKKNSFISGGFNDTNTRQVQRLSQSSLASSQQNDQLKDRKSFLILASQIAYRAKMSVVINEDLLPTPKATGQIPFNHQIFLLSQEQFFLKPSNLKPRARGSQLIQKLSKSTNFGVESMVDFSDSQDEIDELSEQLGLCEKQVFEAQKHMFFFLIDNMTKINNYIRREVVEFQSQTQTFSQWVTGSLKIDYQELFRAFLNLHGKEKALQITLLKINIKQENQENTQLKYFIDHTSHLIAKEYLSQIKIMQLIQVLTVTLVRFIHQWINPNKSFHYNEPIHFNMFAERIASLQQLINKSQKSGWQDAIGSTEQQYINLEPFEVDVNPSLEIRQIYKEIGKISKENERIFQYLSEWTPDILTTLSLLEEFSQVYGRILSTNQTNLISEDMNKLIQKIKNIIDYQKSDLPRLQAVQTALREAIKEQIPYFTLKDQFVKYP